MAVSKRAKRRLIVLASLIVLVGAGVVGTKSLRARQQQRLIEEARIKGVEAYERGDLDEALSHLSQYLQHNRRNPEALDVILMFADARCRVPIADGSHRAEALRWYQTARMLLNDAPDLPDHDRLAQETDQRLIELNFEFGLRAELMKTAERMLQRNPDDVSALSARARALFGEREFARARSDVERLIELEPEDPSWRHLLLQILRSQKSPVEEQIAQCDAWIDEWDGDGRMHLLKAGWLAESGRVEEARAAAEGAAERGADTVDVLQHTVSLLDLLEMGERATDVLAAARSRFPDEQWVPEATVRRRWLSGAIEEALAELADAQEQFETFESGLLKLRAVLLMRTGRTAEARAALGALTEAAADDDDGRADRAWAAALVARLDRDNLPSGKVIEAYREALLLQPRDALLSFLLGEAYASIGERALAIDAFEYAFKIEPNWLAAGAALTEALLAGGRPQRAFEVSRQVLDRAPEKPVAFYLLLARSYIAALRAGGDPLLTEASSGRAIDISAVLGAIVEQFPEQRGVSALLAEAHCLRGRPEASRRLIDERMTTAADADELLSLAQVSWTYDLGLEADLVARARELSWPSVPVALALAELHAEEGRFDEGLALIDEALAAVDPKQHDAPAMRCARVGYMIRMDHPDALAELVRLIEGEPGSSSVQAFALAQPKVWTDARVVRAALTNLSRLLGPQAPQVVLAEANYLLRFQADDEASQARAIMMISEVLERVPDSVPGLILMAQASLAGERPAFNRAVTHLQRAVSVMPGRSELYVQLISLLQRQGNHEEAGRYLQQLSRLAERDPDVLRTELRLLRVQGDFETALLRAGELVDEQSPIADQLLLAALHMRTGDRDAAEAIYGRLLAVEQPEEFAVTQAAEFYANTGRLQRGVELLEQMEPAGGEAARALMLGIFHRRHDQPEEAEGWLRRAVELDPAQAEAHHQLARLYLDESDLPRAKEQAVAGLRVEPEHAGLRATLATININLNAGDRREAIELLRELGGEDDALMATLALLEKVPTVDGATSPTDVNLSEARALIQTHSQFMPAWYLAVALHREAGRVREAIDLARRMVSRFPANTEPAQWATQLLLLYGRWDEALVEAREWRRRTLEDPAPVDVILAQILLELRRPDDAVAQLEAHADRFLAQRGGSLALWIRALVLAGDDERAWQTIRPLLEEDEAWRALWLGLTELADYEAASRMLTLFEPVAGGVGTDAVMGLVSAWTSLGSRFAIDEYFDRAEALIREVPDDPRWRVGLLSAKGRIAECRSDLGGAESAYRALLQEQPGDAAALNNLAFVLSQSPDRCAEALDYAQQALSKQPDHPDLLDTYAHVLLCVGRASEAREALEEALAVRPDDIAILVSLAEVHLALSSPDQAADSLTRARRALEALAASQPALERKIEAAEEKLRQARATVES